MDANEKLAHLKRGSVSLVSDEDLAKKLASGKPLRVKLGSTRRRPTCIWGTPWFSRS